MSTFRVLIIFIFATYALGCPEPKKNEFNFQDLSIGPQASDSELDINSTGPKVEMPSGSSPSSQIFQLIQDMDQLGASLNKPVLRDASAQLLREFYKDESTHSKIHFGNSPYVDLLVSKAKPEFIKATDTLPEFINSQKVIASSVIDSTKEKFNFPTQDLNILAAISEIAAYFNLLESEIKTSKLDPAVKSEIIYALYEKFWTKLPAVEELAKNLVNSKDFTASVQVLRSLLTELEVELDPNAQSRIDIAEDISSMLEQDLNPKSAFILLLTLWDNMDAAQRKETFGDMSPDLYEFLSSKKRKQIDCMKRNDCKGFIDRFIRKHIILPKIKEYGVDKLKAQINESAAEQLNLQTGQMATELVKEMPDLIRIKILDGLSREEARYLGMRENFEGFVSRQAQKWFESEFSQSHLPALENRSIRVERAKQTLKISGVLKTDGSIETSSDTLGAALLASSRVLEQNRSDATQSRKLILLQRLNQLLAHGGFSLSTGESFPALSRSWNKKAAPLNIEKSFRNSGVISMPSPLTVLTGFSFSNKEAPTDLRVLEQARLLGGFSELLRVFRDWETSPPDDLIQKYTVKELLQEIPSELLNKPAFPKHAFLAVALGNVTSVLNNLASKGTPLFLHCAQDGYVWGDNEKSCPTPTALASLIDIKKGVKQGTVSALDTAAFLYSLITFLTNVEDIKQTSSEYLITPKENGTSPLQEFMSALPEIRKLAVGLTNYLTHILQNTEGKIFNKTEIGKRPDSASNNDLNTQLMAIKAMAASAKYFKIKPYKASAASAYFYLNSKYWNDKNQFYSKTDIVPAAEFARTLVILNEVAPLIDDAKSRRQIQLILKRYSESLESAASRYLVRASN